jgi:phosphoesterase RecJ-like protein
MPLDWTPLVRFIHANDHFVLMTHVRPDADGLGSQIALHEAITALGKLARVVIASPLPPRYQFLDPDRTLIERFTQAEARRFAECGAVIVMDTGTWNQLDEFGPFLQSLNVPKAVIDHHRTQDDLGGLQLVDTSAEATGRLAYELITALGVTLTPRIAQHLFMALALDTGWFRHPNTTHASFELAARLVAAGANPPPLYEQLFECATTARLKLLGIALERLAVVHQGKVAYTEILLKDYDATGAVPGDTEDLINYPRSIEGVEVALTFIEQPAGGTKISFRSRSLIDVSKLAEQFAGGGHRQASGARDPRPLPEARAAVLAALGEALHATGLIT